MNIKGTTICPHVYVLSFDTQYELCMSFVRMQEFYESPKFKGKYFTLEEFIDYWSQEFGHGTFDYTGRWQGFNLTNKAISKWLDSVGNDIRSKENQLLRFIDEMAELDFSAKKYVVVGIYGKIEDSMDVIEHELAHAFYYLDASYRREAQKLIKGLNKKIYASAEQSLLKMGYGKNVIKDEIQAYFSTSGVAGIPLGYRKEFAENFNKYRQKNKLK